MSDETLTDCAEIVYRGHYKKLYRYFYYRGIQNQDTEDCCQEVFLRLFRAYGQQSIQEDQVIKLIFGIAKNVYREQIRQVVKNQHNELFEGDLEEGIGWIALDLELAELDREDLHTQVKELMKNLSPQVKEVIQRRFLEGQTRQEVAIALKMSEKQVHVYQRRGIAYLQKAWQKTVSLHT
jgi:RNA polymerase sigma factor (sigma-70 family)